MHTVGTFRHHYSRLLLFELLVNLGDLVAQPIDLSVPLLLHLPVLMLNKLQLVLLLYSLCLVFLQPRESLAVLFD